MFSAIRRRLHLSPATVIAGLALVFAMSGGAYAAKKYLITSTKQISPSVLKQLQGKAGAPGAAGAQGAQGPAGPVGAGGAKGETGAAGKEGKQGEPGKAGKDGANGKSVEAAPIATGEPACKGQGGAEYTVEGSGTASEICNGKEGEPWHLGGLPKGATETGVWAFNANETSGEHVNAEQDWVMVPISFSVPLSAPITEAAKVHFVGEGGEPPCTGTVTTPTAPEGQLCIYQNEVVEHATFFHIFGLAREELGASVAGAYLVFKEVKDYASGRGSWAVTGA